jgi:nuclear pore complex protein Nup155
MMGLFAEIKQAWITVDNRLYLWDYQTQSNFQGFEGQSNTITCVRLLKPKSGMDIANASAVGGVNFGQVSFRTLTMCLLLPQ